MNLSNPFSSGVYSPITRSGCLLVDGVLASCYASFPHNLAHTFMLPVRLIPSLLIRDKGQVTDLLHPIMSKFTNSNLFQTGRCTYTQTVKKLGDLLGKREKNFSSNEVKWWDATFFHAISRTSSCIHPCCPAWKNLFTNPSLNTLYSLGTCQTRMQSQDHTLPH